MFLSDIIVLQRAVRLGAELRRPDPRRRPLRRDVPREPASASHAVSPTRTAAPPSPGDRPRDLRRADDAAGHDAGRERPFRRRGADAARDHAFERARRPARRRRSAAPTATISTRGRRARVSSRRSDRRTRSRGAALARRAGACRSSTVTGDDVARAGQRSDLAQHRAGDRGDLGGFRTPRDLGIVERHLAEVVQQRRHLEVVARRASSSPSRSPIADASAATRSAVPGGHQPTELGRHRQRFDRLPVRAAWPSRAARRRTRPRASGVDEQQRSPDADVALRRRRRGIRSPSTCPTTRPPATPAGRGVVETGPRRAARPCANVSRTSCASRGGRERASTAADARRRCVDGRDSPRRRYAASRRRDRQASSRALVSRPSGSFGPIGTTKNAMSSAPTTVSDVLVRRERRREHDHHRERERHRAADPRAAARSSSPSTSTGREQIARSSDVLLRIHEVHDRRRRALRAPRCSRRALAGSCRLQASAGSRSPRPAEPTPGFGRVLEFGVAPRNPRRASRPGARSRWINASTHAGWNWMPALSRSSWNATSCGSALRYAAGRGHRVVGVGDHHDVRLDRVVGIVGVEPGVVAVRRRRRSAAGSRCGSASAPRPSRAT